MQPGDFAFRDAEQDRLMWYEEAITCSPLSLRFSSGLLLSTYTGWPRKGNVRNSEHLTHTRASRIVPDDGD
jgi:hypothetical protein